MIDRAVFKAREGCWIAENEGQLCEGYPIVLELEELVSTLSARIRELEAGLAFYADEKNYEYPDGNCDRASPVENDVGTVARALLAGEAAPRAHDPWCDLAPEQCGGPPCAGNLDGERKQ